MAAVDAFDMVKWQEREFRCKTIRVKVKDKLDFSSCERVKCREKKKRKKNQIKEKRKEIQSKLRGSKVKKIR